MMTAIDTNVLIALWDARDSLNVPARNALDSAYESGKLVVSGVVFAELLSGPGRTERMIEEFLGDTGIIIDWTIDEGIWRSAARAYQSYAKRRKKQKQKEPKRILTDFLIGAHAAERNYSLLTLDQRIFKAAFPHLKIIKG
jgi:predicted nucleic acid-binding protein